MIQTQIRDKNIRFFNVEVLYYYISFSIEICNSSIKDKYIIKRSLCFHSCVSDVLVLGLVCLVIVIEIV